MIEVLNIETAHRFGDALPILLKLRFNEFVERLDYKVPTYNGMEYDQYDTPAAVYIAWRDADGRIAAGSRISPTHRPYMIKDLWPQSVQYQELPCTPRVWEITRFFVDRSLNEEQRIRAHAEILCAYLEFALKNGIRSYIGTAPPRLWKHTLIKYGWPVEFLGPVTIIDYSEKIQTGFMHVSAEVLAAVRLAGGIIQPVLPALDVPMEKAA